MTHNSPSFLPSESNEHASGGSVYGGSLLRLEYENMERRARDPRRSVKLFENIIVGVGFGAGTLLGTMVLVAVGAAL